MFKKITILYFFFSSTFAQINTKVELNFFSNDNQSILINSQNFGLYEDYQSSSNIHLSHYLDFKNSNTSILLDWFINDHKGEILKFDITSKRKYGQYKVGMFSKNRIYESHIFSTGSMIFSNNAKIIPGVGYNTNWIEFFNYFQFKVDLFQGKFPSQVDNNGPFLHYKSVMLKKEYDYANFGFQIQHAVQFGGDDQNGEVIPINLRTFFRMVAAQSGDDSQPGIDQNYKIGNGLGAYIFSFERKLSSNKIKLYYEHFFDDKSGAKLKNFSDGLYGIEIKKNRIGLFYEKLETTNQSGSQHPPGVDSYYWHEVYQFGWTNKNLSIGNAFINPLNNRKKIQNISIEYNFDNFDIFARNIQIKEFIPYTDKNNNKPYKDTTILQNSFNFFSYGLSFMMLDDKNISIIFADEEDRSNIKLSLSFNI
tara:strand:- start:1998 stop:3263 length:1266 start_codon:yes stop_codon:yes gene_type:complete